MNRRNFMFQGAFTMGGLSFLSAINKSYANTLEKHLNRLETLNPMDTVNDTDFWNYIRESFTISPNLISEEE